MLGLPPEEDRDEDEAVKDRQEALDEQACG
jgi:hypothetical protein